MLFLKHVINVGFDYFILKMMSSSKQFSGKEFRTTEVNGLFILCPFYTHMSIPTHSFGPLALFHNYQHLFLKAESGRRFKNSH